jgi:hypothetical protein
LIDDQIRGSAVWVEKEDLLASVTHPGRPGSHSLSDANDRRLALRGEAPWPPPLRSLHRDPWRQLRSRDDRPTTPPLSLVRDRETELWAGAAPDRKQ